MLMLIKDGQFIHDLEEAEEEKEFKNNSKPIQKSLSMTQSSKFLQGDVNPIKLNFKTKKKAPIPSYLKAVNIFDFQSYYRIFQIKANLRVKRPLSALKIASSTNNQLNISMIS